jgi:hypothetical protein
MRKIYLLLANTLFVLHGLLVIFILFGWIFPSIKIIYLAVLLLWLSSWIFLGYCPPTKWEFLLRKKYDKNIDTNAEAIQYYMYKFFKKEISSDTIFTGGLILFIILVLLTIFM